MSDLFDHFKIIQRNRNQPFTILKIAVNSTNEELINVYKNHFNNHNSSIIYNAFYNSGFDLFVPETVNIEGNFKTAMVSMDVKCEMVDSNGVSIGYYMYPRSSISKTPLMLANHVGIIDSGYRGNLIGAFRSTSNDTYTIEKYTKLLQITNVNLTPIFVEMVNESELSTTERGAGGFGSTGL